MPVRNRAQKFAFPFSKKLKGKTKKEFEIVITRYKEPNIIWSDNYKDFRTVYNKGKDDVDYPCIKLDNYGMGFYTNVTHIINNYDNLADVTFFAQAIINDRDDMQIPDLEKFISTDKNTLIGLGRYMEFPENFRFRNYIETIGEAYYKIFNQKFPEKPFIFGLGGWVSVSKEIIRNCPLSVWKKMQNYSTTDYPDASKDNSFPGWVGQYRRSMYLERLFLHAMLKKYTKI